MSLSLFDGQLFLNHTSFFRDRIDERSACLCAWINELVNLHNESVLAQCSDALLLAQAELLVPEFTLDKFEFFIAIAQKVRHAVVDDAKIVELFKEARVMFVHQLDQFSYLRATFGYTSLLRTMSIDPPRQTR